MYRARDRDQLLVELLTPKHKEFVFLDRPANLVPNIAIAIEWRSVRGWRSWGRVCLTQFVERFVGIEALIAVKKTAVTVPLVGPALGDDGDLSTSGLAKFCLI